MEALEYEKNRIKMCKDMILNHEGCGSCPAYDGLRRRCRFPASVCAETDEERCKENVAIVEQWAKNHPVKTRQSEFLKMFPHANINSFTDTFCVAHFDKTKTCKASAPTDEMCEKCRDAYWNEEVSE